jgi:curved DNA-binding protein CbpA
MTDLYELLGVKRNATQSAIRKAYRKKVQKAHPDVEGGSEAAFNALKEAHDVLMDTDRRLYYDSTGKIQPDEPDAGRGPVLAVISSALAFCVNAAAVKSVDLKSEDLIEALTHVLTRKRGEMDKEIAEINRRMRLYTELAGRFEGKDGDNALDAVVTGTLSTLGVELRMRNDGKANTEEALKLVKLHTFRRELVRFAAGYPGMLQGAATTAFIIGPG